MEPTGALAAPMARRGFLASAIGAGLVIAAPLPAPAVSRLEQAMRTSDVRCAQFVHAFTGERFDGVYYENGQYLDDAMGEVDWVLRDYHFDKSVWTDLKLIDLIAKIKQRLGHHEMIVTSGYRTAETNKSLRSMGAAKRSLHMKAKAVDFYSPSLSVSRIARVAAGFQAGGVGRYDRRGFVHADVGAIRYWRG